jgi:hypothetical protein
MIASDVSVYVIAAYTVSAVLLGGLVVVLAWRAHTWAKRARALERKP